MNTLSIKKSRSTEKMIVVTSGRIKVGEIVKGKFSQTYKATKSEQLIIENFVQKNNL